MAFSELRRPRRFRRVVWFFPALLILVFLLVLLILDNGGVLSGLGYKSF